MKADTLSHYDQYYQQLPPSVFPVKLKEIICDKNENACIYLLLLITKMYKTGFEFCNGRNNLQSVEAY